MRSIGFFALGLAAGFLAGTQWRGPAADRGRATAPPRVPEGERVVPTTIRSAPARVAVPGAAAPEGGHGEDGFPPGVGRLAIECPEDRGYEAWIDTTDFTGRPVRVRTEEDGGTCWFDLPAGTYDVEWSDPSGVEHRGTRARVEAGLVTRVGAQAGTLAPLAAHLGRLEVRVESTDGDIHADLPVAVDGPGLPPEVWNQRATNAEGWCAFTLAPGRYEVRAGEGVRLADVRAGETTRFVFRHVEEGDLLLSSLPVCRLRLDHRDGRQIWIRRPVVQPEAVRVLFVPAGEYVVWAVLDEAGEDRRDLGAVGVETGRTTPFDPRLPPGSVYVFVTPHDHRGTPPWVHIAPEGTASWMAVSWKTMASDARRVPAPAGEGHLTELGWRASFTYLVPGRYRLRVRAAGFRDHEQIVDVGDDQTCVDVQLVPQEDR